MNESDWFLWESWGSCKDILLHKDVVQKHWYQCTFLGSLIFFCIWERTLAGINLQNWLAWRVVMSAWTKGSSASCIGVICRSDYHWLLLNFTEIQVIKPHFFLLLYFCLPVLPMDTGGKRPAVEATAVVLLYVQSLNSGSESELCV